ncbi:MAG: autotransporter outer membrane beta-barrel domain-containing protein [Rickettsia endosymbiont of Glossina mortisans submortisans]|nr:autotransporter outer membrane beta-barrel domain-containing protein [Rickettsia endosymbiont of Glossina mortisans submortisans]
MQKEVIREKSALVMKNPEKHAVELAAVELAKELINNKAELKEVAKVANDNTVVVSKTKQEQSLLFVANLAQVAPDNAKKVVEHLTEQGTRSVSVANVTAEAVTANINNHLSGGTMIAVAAGDEETPIITKKGLWVAGTFGSSTQDAYKGNPSYKGTVSGGTIGGDLYIGENSLVDLAYSRMNSDFKFKGSSTGDKLSAESDIISLYGQQQFSNGLILQEIFSASNSKINKKDLRPVGPNSYKTASGKYTSKAYGFEGNVGYQFSAVDGINLMPNIGIRYNTYKDNAYTETGTGVNNMYVAGKSGNLTTGIAGIKLTAPTALRSKYTSHQGSLKLKILF